MELKEVARRVISAAPVARGLHAVNANQALADRTRSRLYHRVTKKIPARPEQVFTHAVPGGRTVRFHLDGTVRKLYWTGSYEADALPVFTAYAAQSAVILDVGAAEGVYSLFAAAVNPSAAIVAFEPGRRQLDRLRANVAANAQLLGDRLQVAAVALSDADGTAEFHELPGGTSSLNADFRAGTETRVVELARGDRVVPDLVGGAAVDLVKIDTESTEPQVLRGLTETIERDRPVIVCEVLSGRSETELQPLVDRWGYRTWWLSGDGPVERAAIEGDPASRHVNWLFLPDDRTPLTGA